jgi:demethylmenaquinone methyltransferase / 2-methoxy-6-polyprenyl-1,4-benzoquinol methylase
MRSPPVTATLPAGSKQVQAMFGRIAGRYDLLNRVLSARLDLRWRRIALGLLPEGDGEALDLACGTFDLGLMALSQQRAARVHGCDFCVPMLSAGAGKRQGRPLSAAAGDALRLPYADAAFDVAMVAYGWRNFGDPLASARELRRVLRPGGHLLILEFFRPVRWWPKTFYATFGRGVFPIAGAVLAGDRSAYRYLHDSVQGFVSTAEADVHLREAGFGDARWRAFSGGVSHAVAVKVV